MGRLYVNRPITFYIFAIELQPPRGVFLFIGKPIYYG